MIRAPEINDHIQYIYIDILTDADYVGKKNTLSNILLLGSSKKHDHF